MSPHLQHRLPRALAYIEFVGYVLPLARWEATPWGAGTFW